MRRHKWVWWTLAFAVLLAVVVGLFVTDRVRSAKTAAAREARRSDDGSTADRETEVRPAAQRPHAMPAKKWPPPGFPLVQGDHALTATWSIHLPEQFARRVEDGSLVLWRPGLTIWLAAWGNDDNEAQTERLAWIKEAASPGGFDVRESVRGGVTRFSYRLREENQDGAVESLNAYVIGDEGQLQLSVYFDDLADEAIAQRLAESVAVRRPPRG